MLKNEKKLALHLMKDKNYPPLISNLLPFPRAIFHIHSTTLIYFNGNEKYRRLTTSSTNTQTYF